MRRSVIVCSAILVLGTAGGAVARPSLQDQRQAACYNDAQRLCGQFIPDAERVEACMKPRKREVSAKCRALWDVKG